ncbi:glycosyltransferase family 4 protein [Rhodobacter sp. NSM]|uniref:glycosyltransferase family 4 protein n=1 Tax=Rhodobacter sp. NSM TaxID=3457501 RepID=UPI003FD6BA03
MTEATQKMVLITTPSLDQFVNVSGVAAVVRGILTNCDGPNITYRTVIIGKSDNQRRGLAWAFEQLAVPFRFMLMVLRNRPHIIHINGPLNSLAILRDLILLILARSYSKHVIYHVHGGTYVSTEPSSRLMSRLIAVMLSLPALILVLGEREAKKIIRLYGADTARVGVLPNAVNVPRVLRKNDSSGPLKVLSLGRLSQEKGLDVLCAAFERDPDLRTDVILRLYGAGPMEQGLLPRFGAALGSSFVFGGVAHEEERDSAYDWADVLVMPSLCGEGLPMVLLEAMSMGVVPIATADGMIADVVVDGETGYLIQKNSPTAISDALKKALQEKENGAFEALSRRAHERILRRHSMHSYAAALKRFYSHVRS